METGNLFVMASRAAQYRVRERSCSTYRSLTVYCVIRHCASEEKLVALCR